MLVKFPFINNSFSSILINLKLLPFIIICLLADKIEISIRTFSICARIFESADADFSDDDCKRMILKQLKLQAVRGGKKY